MASGSLNVVARRAIDEIFDILHDEVDIAKSALSQVNAMIAEIEAIDDPFEGLKTPRGRSEPLKVIWTSWMQQSTPSRHMVSLKFV
nr:hypothetical protein [Tanacetum cinerariifolium]